MRTASTWPPWKPTSRRRRSVMCGLHDLGEHAAGGLGVHKCHAALLDPASRLLVDHPDPGLAHPLQRGVDVGGAVGHVVHPGAVLREEASQGAVGLDRGEQLHVGVPYLQQRGLHAELLHGLAVLLTHAEAVAIEGDRLVEVLDGHADVIDLSEHPAEITWRPARAVRSRPPARALYRCPEAAPSAAAGRPRPRTPR